MQPVCKLPRQGRISGYKHDEHDGLNSVQGEQGEHSTTSTTGCIGVHCRASLLYSRIISPMEMIVFNDNHYLASAIYRLTLTCLETLLYHKL